MAKTVKKKKSDKAPASKKALKVKTVKKKAKQEKVIAAETSIAKRLKKKKKKETPVVIPETAFHSKKKKNKKEISTHFSSENNKTIKANGRNGEASFTLAESVIKGLQDKKGKKIVWLNLSKVENAVADHFIICEAESTIQVNALGRSVEEVVKDQMGEKPWHSEGKQNAQWILVDYVSVVVHIFQTEMREFYNLEALWADAEVMEVEMSH